MKSKLQPLPVGNIRNFRFQGGLQSGPRMALRPVKKYVTMGNTGRATPWSTGTGSGREGTFLYDDGLFAPPRTFLLGLSPAAAMTVCELGAGTGLLSTFAGREPGLRPRWRSPGEVLACSGGLRGKRAFRAGCIAWRGTCGRDCCPRGSRLAWPIQP